MGSGSKLHHLSWLFLVGILFLAACGENVIASNGTVVSATSRVIATVTAIPTTAPPTKETVATGEATAASSSADTPDPQK